MELSFDPSEDRCPWGGRQPKFERLECDGPCRFFLVGRLESGEPIRVQLTGGSHEHRPE